MEKKLRVYSRNSQIHTNLHKVTALYIDTGQSKAPYS